MVTFISSTQIKVILIMSKLIKGQLIISTLRNVTLSMSTLIRVTFIIYASVFSSSFPNPHLNPFLQLVY